MPPRPGLEATATLTVTEADTAVAQGSGDVPVLATPRLMALCEEATVAAVSGHLEAGQTTVGTNLAFEHLAASPVGAEVTAHAVLVDVDRRMLVFAVGARQGDREIARGRVVRVMLERDRFLEGAHGRD